MWSSRRSIVAGLLAVLSLTALTACGFRPLYGDHEGGGVVEDLSQVHVGLIENRSGQILRNELLTLTQPRGPATDQPYELVVRLSEQRQSLAIAVTRFTTRYNYVVNASFSLHRRDNPVELLTDSTTLTGSYDVVRSEFATVVSERDVQERLLRQAAQAIATRVAAHFRQAREQGPKPS